MLDSLFCKAYPGENLVLEISSSSLMFQYVAFHSVWPIGTIHMNINSWEGSEDFS